MTWHPMGDRILFWEGQGDPFGPPTAASRIVVATSPTGTRQTPSLPRHHHLTPSGAAAGRFRPSAPAGAAVAPRRDERHSHRHPARRPEPEQTVTEVRYDRFSDDGEWVIDGTESATHDNGLLGATPTPPTWSCPVPTMASCGPTPPSAPAASTAPSSPTSTGAPSTSPERARYLRRSAGGATT